MSKVEYQVWIGIKAGIGPIYETVAISQQRCEEKIAFVGMKPERWAICSAILTIDINPKRKDMSWK